MNLFHSIRSTLPSEESIIGVVAFNTMLILVGTGVVET
jgi:hypothetical protein